MNKIASPTRPVWSRGPHAGILAIVALALTVAAVVLPALITGHAGYVDPASGADAALRQARQRHTGLRTSGFLMIGTAPPLVICAAAWCAQFRRRGLTVPGPLIALAGGVMAAGALLAGGGIQWSLSRSTGRLSPDLAHLASQLAFAAGGVGFVVPFGLLVAGVAVSGLLGGLLPRFVAWPGIALAGLAELSWLVLIVTSASPVLPVVRFGGLVWLVVAGFTLRPARPAAARTADRLDVGIGA